MRFTGSVRESGRGDIAVEFTGSLCNGKSLREHCLHDDLPIHHFHEEHLASDMAEHEFRLAHGSLSCANHEADVCVVK